MPHVYRRPPDYALRTHQLRVRVEAAVLTRLAVVSATGTATVGAATSTGGLHAAACGGLGTTTVGTSAAAGGNHTGSATTVVNETATATVGTAAAGGGGHVASASASNSFLMGWATAGSFMQQTGYFSGIAIWTTAAQGMAQAITPFDSGPPTTIDFQHVMNSAGGTGNVWAELRADASNTPGSVLATSTTKAKASLNTTTPEWNTYTFPSSYFMITGTQYWLALMTDTPDNDIYGVVGASGVGYGSLTGQGRSSFNGTTWGTPATSSSMMYVIPRSTIGGAGTTGIATAGTAAAAGGSHVISAAARGNHLHGFASASSGPISQTTYKQSLNNGRITGYPIIAQSFVATTSPMNELAHLCAKSGTPTDNWYVEIQTNTAGPKPTGTTVATSDQVASPTVSGFNWFRFPFSTLPSLTPGSRYWWFMRRTGGLNDTNYLISGVVSAEDFWDTEGINASTADGVTWGASNLNYDMAFDIPATTLGSAGTTGVHTASNAAADGGTHTGAGGSTINESGTATVGTTTATGGAHTAASGATGATTIGTATATGGSHTGTGLRNEVGNATRGQATASGGAHTGSGQRFESGTHTRGQATAAGGAHTAGGGASGTATSGTATAPGGSTVATAGATGAAATGVAAAAGGTHTTVVTQTTGVIGDVTSGGWTREDGSTTNLYDSINEGVAADADYIRSPLSPASPTAVTLQLGPLAEPTTRNDHIISYRYSVDAPVGTQLIVRLYQGETLIATDAPQTPTETWVTRDWELDVADAEDITDYSNLRVELEAVVT